MAQPAKWGSYFPCIELPLHSRMATKKSTVTKMVTKMRLVTKMARPVPKTVIVDRRFARSSR